MHKIRTVGKLIGKIRIVAKATKVNNYISSDRDYVLNSFRNVLLRLQLSTIIIKNFTNYKSQIFKTISKQHDYNKLAKISR